MNKKSYKNIVWETIILLIPFILYGIYKNGILIYNKDLINEGLIFKNIYITLISIVIKIIYDLIKYKKIIINYDLVYLILISMIIPYKTNILIYTIVLIISYILSKLIEKYFKCNQVCLIFLIIYLINGLITNNYSFNNLLEDKFTYSFSIFDILMGRSIGGISSTSILFSLISYIYLVNTLYYKKDIPLTINITYIILAFIYYLITKEDIIINSELIFSSIFIATLPKFTPYKERNQKIYGICIGILTFILYIIFNNIWVIYLSILIISLSMNIKIKKKKVTSA